MASICSLSSSCAQESPDCRTSASAVASRCPANSSPLAVSDNARSRTSAYTSSASASCGNSRRAIRSIAWRSESSSGEAEPAQARLTAKRSGCNADPAAPDSATTETMKRRRVNRCWSMKTPPPALTGYASVKNSRDFFKGNGREGVSIDDRGEPARSSRRYSDRSPEGVAQPARSRHQPAVRRQASE